MSDLTLGKLADQGIIIFSDGYRTRRDQLAADGFPILRVAELGDGIVIPATGDRVSLEYIKGMGDKVSQSGDVLISTKGTVGRVARVPDDFPRHVYSPQLCYLRVNDPASVHPRWLYYMVRSDAFRRQVAMYSGQTDMAPYLSLGDLATIRIVVPDIEEQKKIASLLGAFDDLMEANRTVISSSLALISTLYKTLMSKTGAESLPLLSAFKVEFGAAFKGERFVPVGSGMPLIRIRDLKTFEPDTWTTERIASDIVVEPGDVLVGMDAEFRPTYWLGEPGLLNQRVCRVSSSQASPAFVREALVAPMAFIEGHKTGTTVSHLNKADLAETRVVIPRQSDLAKFDSVADPLRRLVVGLHSENRQLAQARDELLPLLMSGRVRVGEVAA